MKVEEMKDDGDVDKEKELFKSATDGSGEG